MLSLTDNASRGAQFLNRFVIRQALPGLINTTVLDYSLTNVTHTETWAIYARFLLFWTYQAITGEPQVTTSTHILTLR